MARSLTLPPPPKKAAKAYAKTTKESRSETRVPVRNQFAEATILTLGAPKVSAEIVDISRSGIGLVLGQHLPEGTWIKLKIGQVLIFGHIRYCRDLEGGGYRAGFISDTVISPPNV